MDRQMEELMDIWMDEQIDKQMDVHVQMNAWIGRRTDS